MHINDLGGRFITVKADGVKTFSTLLSELIILIESTFDFSDPTIQDNILSTRLFVDERVFNCSFHWGMTYVHAETSDTQMIINSILFRGYNPPVYRTARCNNQGNFEVINKSNFVPDAGQRVSLIY